MLLNDTARFKNHHQTTGDTTTIIVQRRVAPKIVEVIIDTDDLPMVLSQARRIGIGSGNAERVGYALIQIAEDGTTQKLHRWLMDAPAGTVVDHLNGNPLDNRRANLRITTQAENVRNRLPWGTSGMRGVFYHKRDKVWRLAPKLGSFESQEEAVAFAALVWKKLGVDPDKPLIGENSLRHILGIE